MPELRSQSSLPPSHVHSQRVPPTDASPQEDLSALEQTDLTPHSRASVQLRLAEKQILEKASASGRGKRLHFQRQLEEGAALPRYEESDIALLENEDAADAKLPIVLRKLEEVVEEEEQQQQQAGLKEELPEETPLLLNGGKAVYGTDGGRRDLADAAEANGETAEVEVEAPAALEKASKAAGSALDMSAGLDQLGLTEGAKLSAN